MKLKEARLILHPNTTEDALRDIEYHAGFNARQAGIEACEQACIAGCNAIDAQEKIKDYINRISEPEYKDVTWNREEIVLLLRELLIERAKNE